jgi:hypothetical protein
MSNARAGGRPTPEAMAGGVCELLADVAFCRAHAVRPAKFAEHASTAADFFFQVQRFEEAEATLIEAIQARVACMLGACWRVFRSNPEDMFQCWWDVCGVPRGCTAACRSCALGAAATRQASSTMRTQLCIRLPKFSCLVSCALRRSWHEAAC